mgnify:CR=1 FL=1
MLIYCPKCSAGYEIDEDLIKDKSRKVKCSHCNKVFDAGSLIEKTVDNLDDISEENAFDALAALMRDADVLDSSEMFAEKKDDFYTNDGDEADSVVLTVDNDESVDSETVNDKDKNIDDEANNDVENEENVAEEVIEKAKEEENPINIESIYERLSEHTSHLIERENKLPFYEKVWFKIKEVLGFHFRIRWKYVILGILIFVSLSLFNNRYDVVRKFPFMNGVYKVFGIKAKIAGEGLEFQNITWDYFIEDGIRKMEVKGFINNVTAKSIDIPTVHIEILDNDTSLLQSFNRELKDNIVSPTGRIPLQFVVENPAPTAKYVYFTFIDKE